MRKVSRVKVLPGYRLDLEFDDGVTGTVDLAEAVGKGVFSVWRDLRFFEQVSIGSSGELVWGKKVDLCPDALCLTRLAHRCLRSVVPSGLLSRCSLTITTPRTFTRSMAARSLWSIFGLSQCFRDGYRRGYPVS